MFNHPGSRPRNINLFDFKFPLNAKLSILHRITGVVLILCLIAYLGVANLVVLHPVVTFEHIINHWIIQVLNISFWLAVSFHWLTGLRHLLAEHLLNDKTYKMINSNQVSYFIFVLWGVIALFIFYYILV
jgi:succinate dehydrogenase / fumarate reductase cytochrome b subunit